MNKQERYVVIVKHEPEEPTEYYVEEFFFRGRVGFAAEYIGPRSKITDKFLERYSYPLDKAKKVMKRYQRLAKRKVSSRWYYKPVAYLRRASKMQADYNGRRK